MSRPTPVPPAFIEELKALLGPGGWLDGAADRAPYETDFRRLHRGTTPLVALPDSTERVAGLIALCAREGVAVVPQGGNTSYCGGATPGPAGNEILLSLRRMNATLKSPPYNLIVHSAPLQDDAGPYYHWHVEVMPKLTRVAGFEWGTGFYINPTGPEEAAEVLREVDV